MVHHGVSPDEERVAVTRMPARVHYNVERFALRAALHPAPVNVSLGEARRAAVLNQQAANVVLMVDKGVAPQKAGHLFGELPPWKHTHREAPGRLCLGAVTPEIEGRFEMIVAPSRPHRLVPHHTAGYAAGGAETQPHLGGKGGEEEGLGVGIAVRTLAVVENGVKLHRPGRAYLVLGAEGSERCQERQQKG